MFYFINNFIRFVCFLFLREHFLHHWKPSMQLSCERSHNSIIGQKKLDYHSIIVIIPTKITQHKCYVCVPIKIFKIKGRPEHIFGIASLFTTYYFLFCALAECTWCTYSFNLFCLYELSCYPVEKIKYANIALSDLQMFFFVNNLGVYKSVFINGRVEKYFKKYFTVYRRENR